MLTFVKYLIIINYQLLNYAVNKAVFCLEVLIYNYKRLKCDIIMTSSAIMNI